MFGPPLWVVEGVSSRVFLFGEVVGVRNDLWLTDAARRALEESASFWREFPDAQDLARSPVLAQCGLSARPLSAHLDEPARRRLEGACAELGLDSTILEPFRPWLAAQLIDQAHRSNLGIDATHGVEAVLTALARRWRKAEHYEFGDAEAAFGLFADLGDELEIEYLMWTVDRAAEGREETDRAVDAWMRGDLSVATEQAEAFNVVRPRLYERVVVGRNRSWVRRIEAMLNQSDGNFVLVGFGHLVGNAGVPALIEQHGLAPRRSG